MKLYLYYWTNIFYSLL